MILVKCQASMNLAVTMIMPIASKMKLLSKSTDSMCVYEGDADVKGKYMNGMGTFKRKIFCDQQALLYASF